MTARTSRLTAVCVVFALAFAAARCGASNPSTPSTPSPTPTPNSPPVISAITLSSPRVEADQTITLTAVVQDAETPVDQLLYDWSVSPSAGAISGTGRTVTWKAPTQQPSPGRYTFTVTVTENYKTGSGTGQNKVDSAPVLVHYNDSSRELAGLWNQFFTDFTTFTTSPAQCVRNFSDSCQGKADELNDITLNRQNFQILDGQFPPPNISIQPDMNAATMVGTCVFQDIPNSGPLAGRKENVPGQCTLTAVYETWQWYLCESHFAGTGPTTPAAHSYPGKLVN